MIQLFRGQVVSPSIRIVIETPQFTGFRMPVKANGIPQALCKDFLVATVNIHAQHGSMFIVWLIAIVTRTSNRKIKPVIRAEPYSTVWMLPPIGQVIA